MKGPLVFDGHSVCHALYEQEHISWSHGGQYGEFRVAILFFVDRLLNNGIFPIFVFDGIDYKQQKVETTLKHRNESVRSIRDILMGTKKFDRRHLPQLGAFVFRDTLEERNIPLFYVDGEGDPDFVAFGNHYGCPVVSSDSDFFMFNIANGYLPMDRLNWRKTPITADFYYWYKFSQCFQIAPELCLAIPAIVGNDFITSLLSDDNPLREDINRGRHQGSLTARLVNYLATYSSLEILLLHIEDLPGESEQCSRQVELNYRQAGEFYNVSHVISEKTLMSTTALRFHDDEELPMWVLHDYRCGHFATSLMQPLVLRKSLLRITPDDPTKETAQYCSRPIRQAIYGILERPKPSQDQFVIELVRHQSEIEKEDVKRVYCVGGVQLPNIRSIESRLTVKDRKSILCMILGCNVDRIEKEWQLVVAASCFWVRMVQPSLRQIQALVLNFVKCCATNYTPWRLSCPDDRHNPSADHKWMESFHCYAQWQCVYKDSMRLNSVLMRPLNNVSPAFLFDGMMVMHYAMLQTDIEKEVVERDKKLYKCLLSVISAVHSVARQ